MKLKFLLFLFFTIIFFRGFSQESSRAFAITGQANGNFNWTDIRIIDMASGNTSATLFENGKTNFSFIDAESRKPVDQFTLKGNPTTIQQNGVAVASNTVALNNPSPTMLMSAAA